MGANRNLGYKVLLAPAILGTIDRLHTYMLLNIEENRSLVRDTDSMAILNVDDKSRQFYRNQRRKILNEKELIYNLESKVETITSKIGTMEGLLTQILEKLNG